MPAMRALAANLGIADRIRFLGQRLDVQRLLADAQIAVLITNWEGLPLSILEAMRAGLPVVASDVGGIAETILEGETGHLVGRGAVDQVRERIGRLLADPGSGAASARRVGRSTSGSSPWSTASPARSRSTSRSWPDATDRRGGVKASLTRYRTNGRGARRPTAGRSRRCPAPAPGSPPPPATAVAAAPRSRRRPGPPDSRPAVGGSRRVAG